MKRASEISRALARAVDALDFAPPVTHVYDPLVYARAPHELYLERYARAPVRGASGSREASGIEALLVGMNPGPFGMAQTGVPFGEVTLVRDWLRIEARVSKPAHEHPARPIEGFACARSEVSGARLWGWARARFGAPEEFFARFFVWNYCPLVFMEASGKNRTPDKLTAQERAALYAPCDAALRDIAELLRPKHVVGIGAFARDRAQEALASERFLIGTILHPSPASPLANKGWAEQAEKGFAKLGIEL